MNNLNITDFRNIIFDYIYGSKGRSLKDIYRFIDNLKMKDYTRKYVNWSLKYLLRKNLIIDIGSDNNHFFVEK